MFVGNKRFLSIKKQSYFKYLVSSGFWKQFFDVFTKVLDSTNATNSVAISGAISGLWNLVLITSCDESYKQQRSMTIKKIMMYTGFESSDEAMVLTNLNVLTIVGVVEFATSNTVMIKDNWLDIIKVYSRIDRLQNLQNDLLAEPPNNEEAFRSNQRKTSTLDSLLGRFAGMAEDKESAALLFKSLNFQRLGDLFTRSALLDDKNLQSLLDALLAMVEY